ncbi:MAG: helix-turn-helix domain-containing protein [Pseudomonadota bacterium]
MVNILDVRLVVEILDTLAPRIVVDRALREAGITRDLLLSDPIFVPYSIQAVIAESVARSLGEPSLGALTGQRFDYNGYQAFAKYVLGAPDLSDALVRSRRAIALIHPGTKFSLRPAGDHLVFGYDSGLGAVVGHRHVNESAIFVITHVFRRYLGQDWLPAWIETDISGPRDTSRLEDLVGTEVRGGAEILAIGVPVGDLYALNPTTIDPSEAVTLSDLPALMGVRTPQTMTDTVKDVMRAQLLLGDLSEESVAHRLSMGIRTLQRALMAEGVSYRQLRNQLIEARARALLAESEIGIDQIATSLGYSEPNNFRRAFRSWTGSSPARFRRDRRKDSLS